MIRILLCFLLLTAFWMNADAQCPGCAINSTFTSPGIYPSILPDGTQNQAYDEDVTFVLFTDTLGFAVNFFKINSISGLPLGLSYECNNITNGCVYDPQSSIYGCVKVCGTPIQSGSFTAVVSVTANLEVVGDQNSTINIPLTIVQSAGGNTDFTFNPASACGSAEVSFSALLNNPAYINTYAWDFGNGVTSDIQNPPTQLYDSAGIYLVSLQTQFSVYALSGLSVSGVNNNWCGDVEEPNLFGCTGSPDLYIVVSDASSNIVYTSSTIDNTNSASWSDINIPLSNPPYSFTIWDEDVVSQNDNLGTYSFNPAGTGTFNFSGNGTSGNYTIGTQVVTTFNSSDSVLIYSVPAIPVVALSGNDTICAGDSVTLAALSAEAESYSWLLANTTITGATDSLLTVSSAGAYAVQITNEFGCSATSAEQTIFQQPALPNINFTIQGNDLTTFLTGYNFQWYLNNNPILGAIGPTHTISQQGNYYLLACDNFGCCRASNTLLITPVKAYTPELHSGVLVYPNPATQILNLELSGNGQSLEFEIIDITGRVMTTGILEGRTLVDVSTYPDGTYILRYHSGAGSFHQRMIISH